MIKAKGNEIFTEQYTKKQSKERPGKVILSRLKKIIPNRCSLEDAELLGPFFRKHVHRSR